MQRPLRRQNGIGIFRTVFRDPRPHIVPVLFARPGGQLITELVVIRNIILIGTAKPLVEREFLRPFGQVGAVFDRKRGLQRTAERRHLRLVHHSVPFEEPDRQQHRTKQTRLLSDHVTDPFHEPPVQVAVLYGVPVFVRHQLFEPRLGERGRRRNRLQLDPFRRPHHDPVRNEIFGMQNYREPQRAVLEPVGNMRPHRVHIIRHPGGLR